MKVRRIKRTKSQLIVKMAKQFGFGIINVPLSSVNPVDLRGMPSFSWKESLKKHMEGTVTIDNLSGLVNKVFDEVAVEAAKVEFVCQRVKDGVVVDTFDTREAALGLVLKHHRQKKAKLQVMNSANGELVLFTEEEMAG